jgi:hypothetical protein
MTSKKNNNIEFIVKTEALGGGADVEYFHICI